jgi:hypothetical protein
MELELIARHLELYGSSRRLSLSNRGHLNIKMCNCFVCELLPLLLFFLVGQYMHVRSGGSNNKASKMDSFF